MFQQSIDSFRLYLAAEGKANKTIRTYIEAVQWFAAAHLLARTGRTDWAGVDREDIQRWMVWLLDNYSDAYASNQYRALQQFFRWWSDEEDLPDPFAKLRPPRVTEKLVPVFTDQELYKLVRTCEGRTFMQRRDHAIMSVFRATGIRLAELAGIRYIPDGRELNDLDLMRREIRGARQRQQGACGQDQLHGGAQPGPVPVAAGEARPSQPA
ncbi:MAG TPA: phage integrase N-terminal SAM-like domain-containing protein [Trebonia sp.]